MSSQRTLANVAVRQGPITKPGRADDDGGDNDDEAPRDETTTKMTTTEKSARGTRERVPCQLHHLLGGQADVLVEVGPIDLVDGEALQTEKLHRVH